MPRLYVIEEGEFIGTMERFEEVFGGIDGDHDLLLSLCKQGLIKSGVPTNIEVINVPDVQAYVFNRCLN